MNYLIFILLSINVMINNISYADIIDNNDGTLTNGSIMWVKDATVNYVGSYDCLFVFGNECSSASVGLISYAGAENFVSGYVGLGYNNWRLPTQDEFRSMFNANGFDLMEGLAPGNTYWADSTLQNPLAFGDYVYDIRTGTGANALGAFGVSAVRDINPIPVPPAIWLFCSGVIGLSMVYRKK